MMRFLIALGVVLSLNLFADDLGIVAFGDWGSGDANQRSVATAVENFCATERCDHVLLLGDNFYPAGVRSVTDPYWESRFVSVYARLDMLFFAALGNHDYGGNIQAQIDYTARSPKWRMPARYYDFTRGDAELFAIDTERFDRPQREWLQRKLEASTARWRIVYGHHPIYSYGPHGDNASLRRDLNPLLTRHVDFYLAGHDHTLQVLRKEGRTAYVVSGAGGAGAYGLRPGPKSLYGSSRYGFVHLRIAADRTHLKVVTAAQGLEYEADYDK